MVLHRVSLKNLIRHYVYLLFLNSISSYVCSHTISYKVQSFYYVCAWQNNQIFSIWFIIAFYIYISFSETLATSLLSAI